MPVQGKFLCVIGLLLFLLLVSTGVCFAWGGFPPRLNVHAVLTYEALVDIAGDTLADQIKNHADGPDFHREKCRIRPPWRECPVCRIAPNNTSCSDTHGHRITEFLLPHEIERYRRNGARGAEEGAVYWAWRARQAYQREDMCGRGPGRERCWIRYLGWATHYLADALAPQHSSDPWWQQDGLDLIPGLSREFLFEIGMQVLDLHEHYGWTLDALCRLLRPDWGCDTVDMLLTWLRGQPGWQRLRNYREWVRNPDESSEDGFDASNLCSIRNWINEKARDISNMSRTDEWPYLSQDDLRKVFARISIGIRGLYDYVIQVPQPNRPPTASAGDDQTVQVGSTVQLDGSSSCDPDGDTLRYTWRFISRPAGSRARLSNPKIAKPTFKADKAGDYVLELKVDDGRKGTATDQVKITAKTDITPPTLIQDFQASDGEYNRSTLSWTNPPDIDLAQVIVKRKTTGYPVDHNDGETILTIDSATPGQAETFVDTGLTGDTIYYYAVFSCDQAGNWNDQVVEGNNADTGRPRRPPIWFSTWFSTQPLVKPTPKGVKFVIGALEVKDMMIRIFDLSGRTTLNTDWVLDGFEWNLTNDQGQPIANGVYIYVVRVRGFDGREYVSEVRKLVIMR